MDLLKKSQLIHTISNHPVHILDKNRDLSPSSFIPFCQFGDKVLGIKIPQFPVPVCNIFRPKILNDQLCYEVDLNQFKESLSASNLKKGIIFFIDNNEDRQYSWIEKDDDRRIISGITLLKLLFTQVKTFRFETEARNRCRKFQSYYWIIR